MTLSRATKKAERGGSPCAAEVNPVDRDWSTKLYSERGIQGGKDLTKTFQTDSRMLLGFEYTIVQVLVHCIVQKVGHSVRSNFSQPLRIDTMNAEIKAAIHRKAKIDA
jgi:hypothetical protein